MSKRKRLPKRVSISLNDLGREGDYLCDTINEFLSTKYGCCTNSWSYTITISDIDWDTDDEDND